jgi:adenosine deaminase
MSVDELRELSTVKGQSADLLDFLQKLSYGVSVLADADACYQVAFDNVRSAKSEELDYAELRFSPRFMAEKFGLVMEEVVEAVIAGVTDANVEYQTDYQLIGILSRTYGADACHEELAALLSFADSLVGIDLAGDEKHYPAKDFETHFNHVRDAGLYATIHAGEAAGPHSVWDAINILGATRIGHGIAVIHDNALIDHIVKNDIGIEACITSNYQTATWTDIKNHPVKHFLERGVNVSLNTDDPAISGITIKDEYHLAKKMVGLTDQQINQLQQNGINQAFKR